jgi:hypothetical protein
MAQFTFETVDGSGLVAHCFIASIPPEPPALETNRPTRFRGAHLDWRDWFGAGEAVTLGTWGWGRRHSPE